MSALTPTPAFGSPEYLAQLEAQFASPATTTVKTTRTKKSGTALAIAFILGFVVVALVMNLDIADIGAHIGSWASSVIDGIASWFAPAPAPVEPQILIEVPA